MTRAIFLPIMAVKLEENVVMIELVDITVSVFMDVQTFFKYMDLKIYSASFPPWPFFREIRI